MATEFRTFSTPYGDIDFYYRPGTSDEAVIKEVVDLQAYRNKKIFFGIHLDEKWLDLGANIGSFVLYALIQNAQEVQGWEPDPECFELLEYNFRHHEDRVLLFNSAVTMSREEELPFWKGVKETDNYRATVYKTRMPHPAGKLKNTYAPDCKELQWVWDGVKMDIEGSEFGFLDEGWLPNTRKLVMEYHLSRDKEMSHFRQRREFLRKTFDNVYHIPSLDQAYPNDQYPGKFDRFIYCWNDRETHNTL